MIGSSVPMARRVALGQFPCALGMGGPHCPRVCTQLGWLREGGLPRPPVPAGGRGVPRLEAVGRLQQGAGVLTAHTDGEGAAWGWSRPPCPVLSSSPIWARAESPQAHRTRGAGGRELLPPPPNPMWVTLGDAGMESTQPTAPSPRQTKDFWGGSSVPAGLLRPGAGALRGHGLRGGSQRGAERGAPRHAAGRLRHRHAVHPRAERRVSAGTGGAGGDRGDKGTEPEPAPASPPAGGWPTRVPTFRASSTSWRRGCTATARTGVLPTAASPRRSPSCR